VFGCVRAAISLVISLNGNKPTSSTENETAATQLNSNERLARRPRTRSPDAKASPLARIGPINGEISIAPIITAGLFSASPSVAMPAANKIWSQYSDHAAWPTSTDQDKPLPCAGVTRQGLLQTDHATHSTVQAALPSNSRLRS
jgi:hypothetical protein